MWDDNKGLNIDVTTANAWNEYVKVRTSVPHNWCCIDQHIETFRCRSLQEKGLHALQTDGSFDAKSHHTASSVRGTHAFRPSQQSYGAVANQPFSASNNMLPPPAVGNSLSDEEQATQPAPSSHHHAHPFPLPQPVSPLLLSTLFLPDNLSVNFLHLAMEILHLSYRALSQIHRRNISVAVVPLCSRVLPSK